MAALNNAGLGKFSNGVRRYDRSDMLSLIESFPTQCEKASLIGAAFNPPSSLESEYRNIVCAGVGGSAIGADLLRSYLADESPLPIFVNRNYTLPKFVNKDTLVMVSSYSGDTEETISAYEDAQSKGAKIVAITSGGKILNMANDDDIPVIVIPKGLPPRCALGYSFFPLLIFLSKIGLIHDKSRDIDETIKVLASGASTRKKISKKIARTIHHKYPVVYGGQDHIDCVVTRWRGQFAENSKTLASSHVIPEMNHNEIVGWENPVKLLKNFTVIILRDRQDHPRNSKRLDIIKKIIKAKGLKVTEVHSVGSSLLARMFSLILIGDYASYYLAILNRLDPTPVERIAYLKKELAKK